MDYNDEPSSFMRTKKDDDGGGEEYSEEMISLEETIETLEETVETTEEEEEETFLSARMKPLKEEQQEEMTEEEEEEEEEDEIDIQLPKRLKKRIYKLWRTEQELLQQQQQRLHSLEEEELEETITPSGTIETIERISISTPTISPSVSTEFQSTGSLQTLMTEESFDESKQSLLSEEATESTIEFEPSIKKKKKKKHFINENKALIPLQNEFEERDMIIMAIRNSIVEEVVDKAFKRFQASLVVPFTTLCMHKSWRKLIYMYSHDIPKDEDISAKPWRPDKPSHKCGLDPWATNEMPIDIQSDVSESESDLKQKSCTFDFIPIFTDKLGMPLKRYQVKKMKGEKKDRQKKDTIKEELEKLRMKNWKKFHELQEYRKKVSYMPSGKESLREREKESLRETEKGSIRETEQKPSKIGGRLSKKASISQKTSLTTKLESFLQSQHQTFPHGHKTSLPQGRINVDYSLLPIEPDSYKTRTFKKTVINIKDPKTNQELDAEKTYSRLISKVKLATHAANQTNQGNQSNK